jgi:hypothetical protein
MSETNNNPLIMSIEDLNKDQQNYMAGLSLENRLGLKMYFGFSRLCKIWYESPQNENKVEPDHGSVLFAYGTQYVAKNIPGAVHNAAGYPVFARPTDQIFVGETKEIKIKDKDGFVTKTKVVANWDNPKTVWRRADSIAKAQEAVNAGNATDAQMSIVEKWVTNLKPRNGEFHVMYADNMQNQRKFLNDNDLSPFTYGVQIDPDLAKMDKQLQEA